MYVHMYVLLLRARTGTLFRLPLRSEVKENSPSSMTSSVEHLEQLFHDFRVDADRSLLFLSSVKKMTQRRLRQNGHLENVYSVEKRDEVGGAAVTEPMGRVQFVESTIWEKYWIPGQ